MLSRFFWQGDLQLETGLNSVGNIFLGSYMLYTSRPYLSDKPTLNNKLQYAI